VSELSEAHVSTTPNKGWEKVGGLPALQQLQVDALRSRGFGDFWQHMLVAEGSIDAAVDAIGVARYDLAAPKIIVEEAGGRFTDRHGAETLTSKSAISSNHRLHESVLKHLQV
jgi:histidinol-phosphatase